MKPLKFTHSEMLHFMDFVARETERRSRERFSGRDTEMRSSLEQVFLGKTLRDLAIRQFKFMATHGKYDRAKPFKLTDPEQYALLVLQYNPAALNERQSMVIDQVRDYCLKGYLAVKPVR